MYAIIADDNTITDTIEIAENFNYFFTSTGSNLRGKSLLLRKLLQII